MDTSYVPTAIRRDIGMFIRESKPEPSLTGLSTAMNPHTQKVSIFDLRVL